MGFPYLFIFLLQDEEFVVLLERGVVPRTHNVRGSNYCFINVFPDRIPGRAIITSVVCICSSTSMFKFIHFYYKMLYSGSSLAMLLETCCRLIILWSELQVKLYRILMWWWDIQKIQASVPALVSLINSLFPFSGRVKACKSTFNCAVYLVKQSLFNCCRGLTLCFD